MEQLLANLATGFSVALTPANLGFALIGALIGTLIGVLPGIGPIATIAMLLPLTFHLEPVSGLIMLAGIFYGAQYGGSTSAILVNLPGETSSVVTCIDGHQMARKGRAGAALTVAALASFFAGTVATGMIAMLAPPLARVGQSFGAPEYFALMVLGLIAAVVLAHGSVVKAIAMIVLGLLLGLVGTDGQTAAQRFTFDLTKLSDGIDFAVLAIGVFGVGEIIANLTRGGENRSLLAQGITQLMPTREEFKLAWPAALRGTALGLRCSACCPAAARRSPRSRPMCWRRRSRATRRASARARSKASPDRKPPTMPARRPRSSRCSRSALPGNAVMALMIGAMMIHGIQPGPQVMTERPTLFWGMVASMWIGNLMLLGHQPAADRHLGAAAQGAVPLSLPRRPAVLRNRRLHHLQQRLRGDPRRRVRRRSATSSCGSIASRRR